MRALVVGSLTLALVAGCGDGEAPNRAAPRDAGPKGPLTVYVVNYPLEYFAGRVGGEHVEVFLPVPANADPAAAESRLFTLKGCRKARSYGRAFYLQGP